MGVGPSPHPFPLLLYFATVSQFSSRSRAFGKEKETAATQATFPIRRFSNIQCSIADVGINCKTTTSNAKNTSKIHKSNFGKH